MSSMKYQDGTMHLNAQEMCWHLSWSDWRIHTGSL